MIPLVKSSTLSRIRSPYCLACLILKSASIFPGLINAYPRDMSKNLGVF